MKKAVLVGVGDYRGLANKLTAPPHEVFFWKSLLMSDVYGFDDVLPLVDQEATPDAVLHALANLLENAKPDDQLLFGFFGHGCNTRCLEPGLPQDAPEKTILVYPTNPSNLGSAAVSFTTLQETVKNAHLPPGVDLAAVLDCCFTGSTNPPPTDVDSPVVLFAGDVVFSSTAQTAGGRRLNGAPPKDLGSDALIVAASRDGESAYQITVNGIGRLLFSMRALAELGKARSGEARPTFNELIRAITPLRPGYQQQPVLLGNISRGEERFPGDPGAVRARRNENVARQHQELVDSLAERTLSVQVDGICCFVDARSAQDEFVKRIVLPHDEIHTGVHRHIAFLEVAVDDVDGSYTGTPPAEQYTHEDQPFRPGDVLYYRWDLSGHRVTIEGAVTTPQAKVTSAYVRHIPQMRKIQPDLADEPRVECFEWAPDASIIAGYFDIFAGRIDVGLLESAYTSYVPEKQWPRGRGAKFVSVAVPVEGEGVEVKLTPFSSTEPSTTIPLKPGTASIRIGNEQHADITGPGSGENPADYFLLYYKLSDPATLPNELPVPDTTTVPINACTSTNWP